MSVAAVAKTISFARGAPSLDIVDVEGLREAAQRALANDPAGVTAYGTSVGYLPLREWIAERHAVDPKQVIVTNGSMQADAFLFDALVEDGDTVIVERPPTTARCSRCADLRRCSAGCPTFARSSCAATRAATGRSWTCALPKRPRSLRR